MCAPSLVCSRSPWGSGLCAQLALELAMGFVSARAQTELQSSCRLGGWVRQRSLFCVFPTCCGAFRVPYSEVDSLKLGLRSVGAAGTYSEGKLVEGRPKKKKEKRKESYLALKSRKSRLVGDEVMG